jgi:hypothetical protein
MLHKSLPLFFLLLFSLSARTQTVLPQLSDSALNTLSYNSFFMYAPPEDTTYARLRMCVKYTGRIDSLVQGMNRLHQKNAVQDTMGEMRRFHWINFEEPMWFYTEQNVHLEIIPKQEYYLLAMYLAGVSGEKNGRPIENNYIAGDFGRLLIDAYGPLIDSLTLPVSRLSPFAYGKNELFYFLSAEDREALQIREIHEITQFPEGSRHPFYDSNWTLTSLFFRPGSVSSSMAPLSLEEDYVFDFDSIPSLATYRFDSRFAFSNGKLTEEGPAIYGPFDFDILEWKKFHYFGDSLSIVETRCKGNCGTSDIRFSQNVYDTTGRVLQTIYYPRTPKDGGFSYSDFNSFHAHIQSGIDPEVIVDTIFNRYDENGLFLGYDRPDTYDYFLPSRFEWEWYFNIRWPDYAFHQVFIDGLEMEKVISDFTGILPEILFMEFYDRGVFTYWLNKKTGKYHRGSTVIMEH